MWGHAPQDASLGSASTPFIQLFNMILSRNLDPNMPKNAYFWEKKL